MPASATSVTVSGSVASFIESTEGEAGISTEGDISVMGSTMTAIGQVSVSANANLESGTWSSYVGSLEFAPGSTLSGGFGGIYRIDAYDAAGTTSMYSVGDDGNSRDFVALEYSVGGMGLGVQAFMNGDGEKAIAAKVSAELGGASVTGVIVADENSSQLFGAEAGFTLDMLSVSVGGIVGNGDPLEDSNYRDTDIDDDEKWYAVTATASFSPTSDWTMAASYGRERNRYDDYSSDSYTLSAKWSPVPQYDVVLAYNNLSGYWSDDDTLGLGMWWKF
jgi:hypothetical protein